jgi:hypothetical protein
VPLLYQDVSTVDSIDWLVLKLICHLVLSRGPIYRKLLTSAKINIDVVV